MSVEAFLMAKGDQHRAPEPTVEINESDFIYADYQCPKCGEYPPERRYKTRQIKLPKNVYMPIVKHANYVNDSLGQGWEWVEFHVCKKCKTKYQISTGSL